MNPGVYRQFFLLERDHWWFAGMRKIYRSLLRGARLPAQARVLDVGCGTGFNLSWLDRFGRAYGLDASLDALPFLAAQNQKRIVMGSGETLPFRAGQFHLACALGVIEHIEDDRTVLSEMSRVLAPGGYVLLSTSAHPWLWSQHDEACRHKRRYTLSGFRQRIEASGLRPIRLSYCNAFLFPAIAAVVGLNRLTGPKRAPQEESSYLRLPPRPVNALVKALFAAEAAWLGSHNLPFGVGIVCLAQKGDASS